MSVDATTGNKPMRQQRVAIIIFYKCGQKGYYRIVLIQHKHSTRLKSTYNHPTFVTQMVTASYAVLQSSLVTFLKELAKVKQTS